MPALTVIIDTQIITATPVYTDWFPPNTLFLVFQSDDTGEYVETGEFVEVAVALFSRIQEAPLIERLCAFQGSINTIDFIRIPSFRYRNDLFSMRLLINPSTGFHCRIIAVSDDSSPGFDDIIGQLEDITEQLENLVDNPQQIP
ncbi:MAG: hypothetical protein JGK24_17170 [Microcoleus sp. PH2017_29_MFU_D_A]|uniref:hypothetical protein n=1 Tax=unclassified Microcoleus TaxID=2642155 RepID=UPI001DC23111|nr:MULTISPECIES: hypothetical protein [unclassified Microcoleus]MCC3417259.1 hypothetical protein [Microcoleus sp. PH2017_07_MST_O_A]MCC3464519.1 hypothetical protein [Microcoleus sp. PH2017_06_SFM_O_A]MCC3503017.1 hypothetical protein [Microcoleus sp. PH2017_19_SFW_U_A]MCC3513618.1 hypothetical protein [Microcoleus sp. PH2017_17_BER_D_A]TAE15467.1 MAG: hypothetical protein EAZ94_04215 [Oscillatoriales cyanobacterium]